MIERIKKFFTLRTLASKVIIAFIIGALLFSATTQIVISRTIEDSEITHVREKVTSDLSYMNDYLGDGEWSVENNTLKKGDLLIGNGEQANAQNSYFKELEDKTDSFFYTFLHTNFVDPVLINEIEPKPGSTYLRVAGSTRDKNNNSIVGTYMEANVSQALNEKGEYLDYALVEGSRFYCLYRTIENSENTVIGAVVVGRSINELNRKINEANIRIIVTILIALALMFLCFSLLFTSWIKAIKKSQKYLKNIGDGNFPEKPLVIKTRDEMSDMANSINEMAISLKEKQRIGSELSLATDIQMSMLPKILPDSPFFDIRASMQPAREVGGDFYDFFMVDDNNVAFVIADVSGKGVPAAMFMAIGKTIIKNYMISGYSPAECFSRVNSMFSENNEMGLFITAWLGLLNLQTGKLTYVNAGHNPPLIEHDGVYSYLRSRPGFVLGGLDGIKYSQNEMYIDAGDRLLLYTDGVTEANDKNLKLYGEQRLVDFLNKNGDKSIDTIVDSLKEDIKIFGEGVAQADDITILMLDYKQHKKVYGFIKTFAAEKEQLDVCLSFVNEQLQLAECSKKIINQIDLAIEEIFVNIVMHGYQTIKGEIEVHLDIYRDVMTLIFKDRGIPFNPLSKIDPDITLSLDDRQVGGLGIYLSKKLMDSMEYSFANGQNILTIKKKIKE